MHIYYLVFVSGTAQQNFEVLELRNQSTRAVQDQVLAIVEQQFKLADKIVLEGILRRVLHGVARVKADAIDSDRTAQIQDDKGTQCAKNSLAREGIFSPSRRDQFQQGRLQVGCCHILDRWCGDPPAPPQCPLSHVLSLGHVVRA